MDSSTSTTKSTSTRSTCPPNEHEVPEVDEQNKDRMNHDVKSSEVEIGQSGSCENIPVSIPVHVINTLERHCLGLLQNTQVNLDSDNPTTSSSSAPEKQNNCLMAEPDEGETGSEISDFSDFSQESWQPVQGPIAWVQEQMRQGHSPRKILEDLVPTGTSIPSYLNPLMLWKIIINIVSEPPKRKKLSHINTMDDVMHLLQTCTKIVVLTGAGVSVSCGIPDFRSRDGVYARLAKDFPNLPDPQAMFDIHFFRNDPRPFFKFAKEIYPGQFHPSLCHRFIRLLEEKEKLLRNYTQNIDTLEQVAGIERVVQCHGSFATATCTNCDLKVDSEAIKDDIFKQVIPVCPQCAPSESAVMKPDIVFFGESLPEQFHSQMSSDKDECDLLIVIGSSLKVRPVALIPNSLPPHVPQILINRERLHYLNFDVELLGNCDDIVGELCRRLGASWEQLALPGPPLMEVALSSLPTPPVSPKSADRSFASVSTSRQIDQPMASHGSSGLNPHSTVGASNNEADSLQPPSENSTKTNTCQTIEAFSQPDTTSLIKPNRVTPQNYAPVEVDEHQDHIPNSSLFDQSASSAKPPSTDDSIVQVTASSSQPLNDRPVVDSSSHNSTGEVAKAVDGIVSAGRKQETMYLPSGEPLSLSKSYDQQEQSLSSSSHKHHHGHHHHHHHHHHHQPHHEQTSEAEAHSSPPVAHSSHQHNEDTSEPPEKRTKLDSLGENVQEASVGSMSGRKDEIDDSLSQESLNDLRGMWQSRHRISLAHRISDNQVLFLPPSRYVFKGAEVYEDSDSDESDEGENSSVVSDQGATGLNGNIDCNVGQSSGEGQGSSSNWLQAMQEPNSSSSLNTEILSSTQVNFSVSDMTEQFHASERHANNNYADTSNPCTASDMMSSSGSMNDSLPQSTSQRAQSSCDSVQQNLVLSSADACPVSSAGDSVGSQSSFDGNSGVSSST